MTERQWQDQVVELLQLTGWQHYHTWNAMHSAPGFPDLVCIHPRSGDHFVAELKAPKGRLSAHQAQWLTWFELAGWDAYVWRPEDFEAVRARLTARAAAAPAAAPARP